MANLFDPQEFFEKTAYYASQGRGLFTLGNRPAVLNAGRLNAGDADLVNTAWPLLTKGIMAKSTSVPGYNLATFEEFSYIGPTRKHPHTQIFGPITVDFFLMGSTLTEARALYHTFILWQEQIAGARFADTEIDRGARSDSTFFAIEYYDNYVTEAELKIFTPIIDPSGLTNTPRPAIHTRYREIYPQAIGNLNTAWESQDAPMTLSVTFEFFHAQSIPLK